LAASTHQPRARGRGGDHVPAARTTRPARLATAAAALALAVTLGVATAFDAVDSGLGLLGTGAATLLLALALAAGSPAAIPFGLLLLGAVYALPVGHHTIAVPIYGSVLLVCGELAYWSLDERIRERADAGVELPRLAAILAVGVAATPVSALVLAAADADVARSPAGTAVGAAAIVACVVLLVALAHLRRGVRAQQRAASDRLMSATVSPTQQN